MTTMTDRRPHELLWNLSTAFIASRCLQVVAELGVADHVGDEPVSAETLAARCGADADALERVLRLLAAHGVFACDGGFRHTPASEMLRTDHPMSLRALVRMLGLPLHQRVVAALEYTVRTGAPAIETVDARGVWAYVKDDPRELQLFEEAMTAKAAADIPEVLNAYDFRRFASIADIGGGRGHLLRAVLDSVPAARGILFDLPEVVGAFDAGHERMAVHAGDFLADPLPVADAYLLMDVLHDWPDDDCVRILRAIRDASPAATVIIVENAAAGARPEPHAQALDLIMLVMLGGRERTPGELNRLLTRAGFTEGTVIETAGPRITEATVA